MPQTQNLDEYGKILNSFGILDDVTKRVVSAPNLVDFVAPAGLTTSELASSFGVSRANLYQEKFRITKTEIQEKIIPLVMAADFAFLLFNDKETARSWVMSPNTHFFGSSPFEACLEGKGQLVIQQLQEWLGVRDGQAF